MPVRKEVLSVLNCEDVEPLFSDYIDGILDRSSAAGLRGHLSFCPECQEILSGVHQVRMALHSLGQTNSPASFKLQLNNRLQEELRRRRWAWMRPLIWGFALATALGILLWLEPEINAEVANSNMAFGAGPEWAVPVSDRTMGKNYYIAPGHNWCQ